MTILVTGATGFLGSALLTELVNQKQDVRILARDAQKARAQFGEAVTIIGGEITDVEQVERAVDGATIIHHLVGRMYHPSVPAELYHYTHVEHCTSHATWWHEAINRHTTASLESLLLLVARFVNLPATIAILCTNLATPQGILLALLAGACFLRAWSIRGIRWKLFLNPVGKVSTFQAIALYQVGVFLNFLLPIRGGEVAKCIMLKRNSDIPLSKSLSTVAMDKALGGALVCEWYPYQPAIALLAFWMIGYHITFGVALFGYSVYNTFYILPTPPGQVGSNEAVGLLVFAGLLHIPPTQVTAMFVFSHPWAAVLMCTTGLICLSALGLTVTGAMKVQTSGEDSLQPSKASRRERNRAQN